MQAARNIPVRYELHATPEAANDAYGEVMVGGIKTACLTRDGLARAMLTDCLAAREIESHQPKLVFAVNGHAIALAARDAQFAETFAQADLIHADGQAAVFASRLMTLTPIPERSATTDFIHDAARIGAEHGLRFFLLGATEEANAKAAEILKAAYPGLLIVGRRHGYFGIDEEDEICDAINLTKPDVVWTGLSVPLEYEFAVRNKARLNAGWLVTCGGCYNFVTGDYARAPDWMQATGLEWLHRLIREPKRLFWRYAVTNPLAIFLLLTRTNALDVDPFTPSPRLEDPRGGVKDIAMSLLDSTAGIEAPSRLRPMLARAWRYGLSTSGPVATSAAHFLASLIFVRNLAAGEFGLFSFVLVIVPFCMSMIGATAVIPVTRNLGEPAAKRAAILATCLKLNLLLSVAAALCVFAFLLLAHAGAAPAALLALFGGLLTARWFARCFAYVQGQMNRAVLSDLAYALALIAGMGALAVTRHVTFLSGAAILVTAALAGQVPLGRQFLKDQIAAIRQGRIRDYAPIFRDLTRWSLLGVVFTEVTVNAHAYLVTFFAGPGAFALLALGMLVMRPISLVQSALPDLERPVMTRAVVAHDLKALARTEREFLAALLAVWAGTVALAFVLLLEFPALLLKKGYLAQDVILVTLFTAAIMMVRNFRTPLAVKLQAAGEFKALAGIGTKSCAVSVIGTLGLLLAFGPIASLGGIFAGEMVILLAVRRLARQWMAQHG